MSLSEDQVKELFENFLRKHPGAVNRPPVDFTLIDGKQIHSGADLSPELLRDFSDHFSIPIDSLRKCSFDEIELLMLEGFATAGEKDIPSLLHIPFKVEQNILKHNCR